MVDTHCHISKEDYDDIDLVIKEALESGISKIIISGCTKESIVESLKIADEYSCIFVTIGYHPSEADFISSEDLLLLEEQIKAFPVIGIGEIGLDYHYGKENIDKQKNLFRKQLELAEKYHLPVVIHSRDATEDTISILKEYPNVKGDIHCFSGSKETAKIYISMGYMIGIGGVVTFKNSNLYKVVEEIGILLETDAPYLTPSPYRGKINSSKYIPLIAEKIADILKITIQEVADITTENATRLFDLK